MVQTALWTLLVVGLLSGCGGSSGGNQVNIENNTSPDAIITGANIPPVPQIPED